MNFSKLSGPFILSLALLFALCSASNAQVPEQLPDPDGSPVDQTKPVKVFILMGQSNMLGFGRV